MIATITPLPIAELSFGMLVDKAWQLFKAHWKFLIGMMLLVVAIEVVLSILVGVFFEDTETGVGAAVSQIVSQVLSIIIGLGWLNIYLKIVRGETVKLNDLLGKISHIGNYIFGNAIVGVIVIFGFLLFIVPGIIWSIKYMFVPYLIVDRNMGPREALKASAKMTDGMKGRLFRYGLGFMALGLLGVIALLIGLLVAIPVIGLASAILYTTLLERIDGLVPLTPPVGEHII
ncbi:MAG: DUF975 family protein [bacterium]|nr:DUF975 family protein [bacterium]